MTELTDTEHRDLIARLYDIHARVAELAEQERDIKARLRAQLPIGEFTVDGRKQLTISATRRFNPDHAEKVLPPELLELCRVPKVDGPTAKRVLPPAVYAQCSIEAGEPTVRLA